MSGLAFSSRDFSLTRSIVESLGMILAAAAVTVSRRGYVVILKMILSLNLYQLETGPPYLFLIGLHVRFTDCTPPIVPVALPCQLVESSYIF